VLGATRPVFQYKLAVDPELDGSDSAVICCSQVDGHRLARIYIDRGAWRDKDQFRHLVWGDLGRVPGFWW
jgi:hypothetical protein